jgi:hypothetical protein
VEVAEIQVEWADVTRLHHTGQDFINHLTVYGRQETYEDSPLAGHNGLKQTTDLIRRASRPSGPLLMSGYSDDPRTGRR